MKEPRFSRATARAVKAAGWDYNIPFRIHQALWCSRLAQKVAGDFVELGTGRGFIMSALLADFPDWANSGRSLHLFDTFQSRKTDKDGIQRGRVSPYYAESEDKTRANFSEWPNVHIHAGDIFETLPPFDVEKIAFLHVDLNFAKAEAFALRMLWPRLSRGGVMLLDDYGWSDAQHQSFNDLAAELGFDILLTPDAQGIVVK